jgi:DNA helicase II / ATP-dependent DNA helicase PcrA
MNESDFLNMLSEEHYINLTIEQRKAVITVLGPVALIAVPGGGKTTVIENRTANLILVHKVDPENILTLTYSKAAALHMEERFNNKFRNRIGKKVLFSTIHSFAYSQVIKAYENEAGIKYTIMTDGNKEHLLKKLYKKYTQDYISEDRLRNLCLYITYNKNAMINSNNRKNMNISQDFVCIYKAYEDYKSKNDYIDFDDMLTHCYKILNECPSLLKRFRNKYKYIQIDECQDLSKIQHEIIKLIGAPSNNVFYVGDEDQCVYSFRGASPSILLEFRNEYKNSIVLFTQKNFRSTSNIVNTANSFIKGNISRFNAKEMITYKEPGSNIPILEFKDDREQIKFIIEKLTNSNIIDTAILYRNNLSTVYVANELIKANIPFYTKESVNSFFYHWVVKDILNFFELSQDLTDIGAFQSIYYKFKSYISKNSTELLKEGEINKSIFSILCQDNRFDSQRKSDLMECEHLFRNLACMEPYKAIKSILDDLNYKDYLKSNTSSYDGISRIISTLKIIAVDLKSIDEFKDRLDIINTHMKVANGNKVTGVTLSTIHGVKGLEFDNVFMIDLIDGIIPSNDSIMKLGKSDFSELEEERRLIYVGMTRARNNLFLLYPKYTNNRKVNESRFVSRIRSIVDINKYIGTNRFQQPQKIKPANACAGKDRFIVGDSIEHKKFGTLLILDIKDGLMRTRTNKGIVKMLSIDICVEEDLIRSA